MGIEKLRTPKEVLLESGETLEQALESHKKWLQKDKDGERLILIGEDLSNVNLSNVNLSNANLSYCNLSYCNLSYCNLYNTNLGYANLTITDLSCANLSYAYLMHADLSYVDLGNANLSNANLSYCNLSYAYLSGVNLTKASFYLTNLYEAKGEFVGIENIGSRNDTTHYFYNDNRVICGCFDGTMEEFENKVKNEYSEDNKYYKQYMIAIDTLKKLAELEKIIK